MLMTDWTILASILRDLTCWGDRPQVSERTRARGTEGGGESESGWVYGQTSQGLVGHGVGWGGMAFPLRMLESLEASRKGVIGVTCVPTGPRPVGQGGSRETSSCPW